MKSKKPEIKKKRKYRSSREQSTFKIELAKYLEANEHTSGELAEIFGVSRQHLLRIKKTIIKPKEIQKKKYDDESLNEDKLGTIRKDLNPIQFCEKYLQIKPNQVQRIIIKVFYSLELTEEERNILLEWKKAGKTTWEEGRKYKELVILAGMKGGKTTLASLFAQIEEYELFKKGLPWKHYGFSPGKEIYIENVATNKEQARDTIFAEIKSSIERSPYFKKRNPYEVGNTFKFKDTNVIIKSGQSNSSATVGKLCKLVLLDELDRFKGKGGKYSADEVYRGLTRSTDPFREDGHIISISSLLHEAGKMVELYLKSKTIPNMLGFWLAEWEMMRELYMMYQPGAGPETWFNFSGTHLPIEYKNEFDKDPEGFLRDKACMMGYTKGKFFRMPHKIDECFQQSHNEGLISPIDELGNFLKDFHAKPGYKYFMHGDASVSHDAYSICIGHREGDNIVIDLIHRIVPPNKMGEIDMEEVKKFVGIILDLFPGIELFTYDTWAATDLKQYIEKRGVKTDNLYILKAQYELVKEKIYALKFKCYIHDKSIEELKGLELVGDKVDHPAGGSKDCADSIGGVIWNCTIKDSGVVAAGVTQDDVDSDSDAEAKDLLSVGRKVLNNKGRKHIWDSGNPS